MIMNFGSMLSGVAALAMVLGCYSVSIKVSGERKAVDDLRTAIARDVRGIRTLQAELRTRARLPELQRWNDEVLALSAPTAGQFVRDPVQLIGFSAQRPEPSAPDMRYALARVPVAPPAAVVVASVEAPAAAPAPRLVVANAPSTLPPAERIAMPAVTASLDLDAAVTGATLERVALRR